MICREFTRNVYRVTLKVDHDYHEALLMNTISARIRLRYEFHTISLQLSC